MGVTQENSGEISASRLERATKIYRAIQKARAAGIELSDEDVADSTLLNRQLIGSLAGLPFAPTAETLRDVAALMRDVAFITGDPDPDNRHLRIVR